MGDPQVKLDGSSGPECNALGNAFPVKGAELPHPEGAGDPATPHTGGPAVVPYREPKGAGRHPRKRRAAGPCWLGRPGASAPRSHLLYHIWDTWGLVLGLSSSGRPLDVEHGHS